MADPKVGTGKKPKGSGRRLNPEENPKDTVSIKFATVQDAKQTIAKVKKLKKSFARKIQILTVLEQRARFAGKAEQAALARKAKEQLRKAHGRKTGDNKTQSKARKKARVQRKSKSSK